MILHPYTALACLAAGAAVLAAALLLAVLVLALRLGKVTGDRDRYAARLKAEATAREARARRAEKTYRRTDIAEMVHRINGRQPGAYHRPSAPREVPR